MSRPRVNGPRSLISTIVEAPVRGLVTLTLVPNGNLRCAAVRPSGRNAWPLAVCRPELYWVAFIEALGQVVDAATAMPPEQLDTASDHIISAEVERLAIVFAGEKPHSARLELARIVAEAEMTLDRVRTARVDLVNQAAACTSASRATDIGQNIDRISKRARVADPQPPIAADGAPRNEAGAFLQVLPQLVKLDRYEQRALSRRKRAIRSLLKTLD